MNEPSPIILSTPDAGSRSAGEILRSAREAQGVTLERLAMTIKVTPAKLEDLERGLYDRLPDPNFTRALAMTICRALKIDSAEVLAALPAAKTIPLTSGKPPLNQPFKESRGGSPLFDKQQVNWSSVWSFKWLAPALLLLGALAIYALPDSVDVPNWVHRTFQATEPPADPAASKPSVVAPPSAPALADEVSTADEPPATVMDAASAEPAWSPQAASEPVKPAKAGAPTLVLDSADSSGLVRAGASSVMPAASSFAPYTDPRLVKSTAAASSAVSVGPVSSMVLEAQQESWVEVKDAQGNKLLSRHLLAGERVPLEGPVPLRVVIGNSLGVHVSFKGQGVDLARYTQGNVVRLELK